jgi:hypothetical protein
VDANEGPGSCPKPTTHANVHSGPNTGNEVIAEPKGTEMAMARRGE